MLDTTVPGHVGGALPAAQRDWLDDLAGGTSDPVLVLAHHPSYNHDEHYGLSLADHEALLAMIAGRENIVGYLAGHTHTNRVIRYGPTGAVPFVEVACAKDYPGAWAEYRIYEGGYTQVMRRVAAPRRARVVGARPHHDPGDLPRPGPRHPRRPLLRPPILRSPNPPETPPNFRRPICS